MTPANYLVGPCHSAGVLYGILEKQIKRWTNGAPAVMKYRLLDVMMIRASR
jgi:hypothetical protein